MKELVLSITGGMGLLIFAYLLFSNKDASIGLLNGSFGGVDNTVKVLQGR